MQGGGKRKLGFCSWDLFGSYNDLLQAGAMNCELSVARSFAFIMRPRRWCSPALAGLAGSDKISGVGGEVW